MRTDMSKGRREGLKQFKQFDVGRIDSLRGEWLAATIMSKFNNKVLYHGLQHLYKTEDGGETWKMISGDLSYNRKERNGVYPYLIYHQAITTVVCYTQAQTMAVFGLQQTTAATGKKLPKDFRTINTWQRLLHLHSNHQGCM
jgi:hypothetical protein